jgi:hypothetical protein
MLGLFASPVAAVVGVGLVAAVVALRWLLLGRVGVAG